jgi:hypothetical protein
MPVKKFKTAEEFKVHVNPWFLFRESLLMAFEEYNQSVQGKRPTSKCGTKPDAKKLSKIVSHLWGKQPIPVRKGWIRQARKNKLRRNSMNEASEKERRGVTSLRSN